MVFFNTPHSAQSTKVLAEEWSETLQESDGEDGFKETVLQAQQGRGTGIHNGCDSMNKILANLNQTKSQRGG